VFQLSKLHVNVFNHLVLILDQTYSVLELKVTIHGQILYTALLHLCVANDVVIGLDPHAAI